MGDLNLTSKPDVAKVKKDLNIDQKKLKEAFDRLENVLDKELANLSTEVIPVVEFDEIAKNDNKFDAKIIETIKKRGVVVIRNVIEKDEAKNLHDDLVDYMTKNGDDPFNDPFEKGKNPYKLGGAIHQIYWSKSQLKARHHANMIKVQKALLGLWTIDPNIDATVDLSQPLTYNDRLRFRHPKSKINLGPHWDSGSISHWADPSDKKRNQDIFDGNWEKLDPFCIKGRGMTCIEKNCTFFRAFQGWLSLSNSGPGEGTLKVLPLLKEVIAHIIMRPLLDDIPENIIPGFEVGSPGKCIFFLESWIHSKLMDSMVSIPKVNPGDMVWWHCDIIHCVEDFHHGEETNTVLYIPAGPDCAINRSYIEKAKECFLDGKKPPDFDRNCKASEEEFKDRATLEDLNDAARIMMGFDDI